MELYCNQDTVRKRQKVSVVQKIRRAVFFMENEMENICGGEGKAITMQLTHLSDFLLEC